MKAPDLSDFVWDVLCCPLCSGRLKTGNADTLACEACAGSFPIRNGVPDLFVQTGVDLNGEITLRQKGFYQDIVFPNYDDCDTPALLMVKAQKGIVAAKINESIPIGAKVIEVGCGTGQLGNYLGLNYKRVVSTDMSSTSLELAKRFRDQYQISNVNFIQSNIFALPFRANSFDIAICTGVLHHMGEAYAGFQRVLSLVKPGGYILVGLYNSYGRLLTRCRQIAFRQTGAKLHFLDHYVRNRLMSGAKLRAWLRDQYENPHETCHSVAQLLSWYRAHQVTPLCGIPSLSIGGRPVGELDIFAAQEMGNCFEHFLLQLKWVLSLSSEGGLFMITGRKESAQPGSTLVSQGSNDLADRN